VVPEEEMADSLFIAAMEFLVLVGVHYVDENRVISKQMGMWKRPCE